MKYYIASKDSSFYKDMLQFYKDYKVLVKAFLDFKKAHGFESDLVVFGSEIGIELSANDHKKFKDEFLKKPSRLGVYYLKKKSPLLKDWQSRIEGVKFFERPHICFYMQMYTHRTTQKSFCGIDDVLYVGIDLHGPEVGEEELKWLTEIKPSEFYLAHEAIVAKKAGSND
ncbi:hypothetical protein [Wohlfahrtiimonas larvae]|uniref:Uncharacterized protein n=1 Tax=Wohlfahrtiimonas larvae TaxID=1157986 RepID=A0ABP9MV48_9GAMM|nr:hypothetical protein [Wohlfahrtiimonas larvae]